jgi:hypothetical protein
MDDAAKKLLIAKQKKDTARRQTEYRKRHIKDGSAQRLNVILEKEVKLAIERMASFIGVSNKELLESVLLEAQDKFFNSLSDEDKMLYFNSEPTKEA